MRKNVKTRKLALSLVLYSVELRKLSVLGAPRSAFRFSGRAVLPPPAARLLSRVFPDAGPDGNILPRDARAHDPVGSDSPRGESGLKPRRPFAARGTNALEHARDDERTRVAYTR